MAMVHSSNPTTNCRICLHCISTLTLFPSNAHFRCWPPNSEPTSFHPWSGDHLHPLLSNNNNQILISLITLLATHLPLPTCLNFFWVRPQYHQQITTCYLPSTLNLLAFISFATQSKNKLNICGEKTQPCNTHQHLQERNDLLHFPLCTTLY